MFIGASGLAGGPEVIVISNVTHYLIYIYMKNVRVLPFSVLIVLVL
jgi:hypothetical protein